MPVREPGDKGFDCSYGVNFANIQAETSLWTLGNASNLFFNLGIKTELTPNPTFFTALEVN